MILDGDGVTGFGVVVVVVVGRRVVVVVVRLVVVVVVVFLVVGSGLLKETCGKKEECPEEPKHDKRKNN